MAFLLPGGTVPTAALADPTFAVFRLRFSRTVAAAEQRRAHLLLHLPHPVSQRPHFGHVHNWLKLLKESDWS
jgi:hypothetical protein